MRIIFVLSCFVMTGIILAELGGKLRQWKWNDCVNIKWKLPIPSYPLGINNCYIKSYNVDYILLL
jgi:hypothetical protein